MAACGELRNPDTRTVAFFPDGLRVWLWSRVGNVGGGGQVDSGFAVSTMGGPLAAPFKGRGISELDWSSDGTHGVPPANAWRSVVRD